MHDVVPCQQVPVLSSPQKVGAGRVPRILRRRTVEVTPRKGRAHFQNGAHNAQCIGGECLMHPAGSTTWADSSGWHQRGGGSILAGCQASGIYPVVLRRDSTMHVESGKYPAGSGPARKKVVPRPERA